MNIIFKSILLFLLGVQLSLVASESPLEKLNLVTFLPVMECATKIAKTHNDILASLEKGAGVIEVKNKLYRVYKNIPQEIAEIDSPITLYTGGCSNGWKHIGYSGYNALYHGVAAGPLVTFAYPADRSLREFNFCQEQDQADLNKVYQELVTTNSKSDVIFMGACKGATNKLRFLAEAHDKKTAHIDRIKALIVESPVNSVYDVLKNQWGGKLACALMPYLFASYNPEKLKTIMHATNFPSNIPVLLGSLPKDTVSVLSDIVKMKKHLEDKGASIEHFVAPAGDAQIRHGRIRTSKNWQAKVHQFLTEKGLK